MRPLVMRPRFGPLGAFSLGVAAFVTSYLVALACARFLRLDRPTLIALHDRAGANHPTIRWRAFGVERLGYQNIAPSHLRRSGKSAEQLPVSDPRLLEWSRLRGCRNEQDALAALTINEEQASGWPLFCAAWESDRNSSLINGYDASGTQHVPIPISPDFSSFQSRPLIAIDCHKFVIPYRILPLGALLSAAFYSILLYALLTLALTARAHLRLRCPRCPRCAYSLLNLPTPQCPECGWNQHPTTSPAPNEKRAPQTRRPV